MQIPSLPTDNLYKFFAISGLTLLFVSIFVPMSFEVSLIEKRNNLDIENTKLTIKRLHVKEDQETVIRRIADYFNEIHFEGKKRNFKTIEELFDALEKQDKDNLDTVVLNKFDKMRGELIVLRQKHRKLDVDSGVIGTQEILHTYYEEKIRNLNLISMVGMFFGFMLTIIGFYFWYFKVQKVSDAKDS